MPPPVATVPPPMAEPPGTRQRSVPVAGSYARRKPPLVSGPMDLSGGRCLAAGPAGAAGAAGAVAAAAAAAARAAATSGDTFSPAAPLVLAAAGPPRPPAAAPAGGGPPGPRP